MRVFSFIMLLLMANSSFAGGGEKGGSVGNGGEGDVGPAFTAIAYRIAYAVDHKKVMLAGVSDDFLMLEVLRTTKIIATHQPLFVNGVMVDAMNYPAEKKILVSSNRWSFLSCERRYLLVLHELLGVSGEEMGQNYSISLPATEWMFNQNPKPYCPVQF